MRIGSKVIIHPHYKDLYHEYYGQVFTIKEIEDMPFHGGLLHFEETDLKLWVNEVLSDTGHAIPSERHCFSQNEAVKITGSTQVKGEQYYWTESLETGIVQLLAMNDLIFCEQSDTQQNYEERYGIENYEPL